MKKILGCTIFILCYLVVSTAGATNIEFVPPNDTTGLVWTTNWNDGYANGRGMIFQMLDTVTIDSLGLYQDLTDITLSYEIAETVTTSGIVTSGQTILRTGSSIVTTQGLDWIDFGFTPLTLNQGNSYHFEFTFTGNSNQNFFYNNNNVIYTQNAFTLIDGTINGNTSNSVVPALRVNTADAEPLLSVPVPEPATMLLLGTGLVGVASAARRRKKGQA